MSTTLYERLGGASRIAAIVDDFVDLHLANPLIKARFSRLDAGQVDLAKRHATEFFCAGSGGPERYTGKDLLTAHKGMNISEQEYIAAIDDVLSAMEKHGAQQPERDDVVAILYSLKGQVIRV
jgi:hemoglobin